ncbi:MAG TPA: hypothetical protein VMA77_02290 [Solirubrobacteraceae bacterium]|nr:hypothetical protein [Solirubrobacteraceae bacterium]
MNGVERRSTDMTVRRGLAAVLVSAAVALLVSAALGPAGASPTAPAATHTRVPNLSVQFPSTTCYVAAEAPPSGAADNIRQTCSIHPCVELIANPSPHPLPRLGRVPQLATPVCTAQPYAHAQRLYVGR